MLPTPQPPDHQSDAQPTEPPRQAPRKQTLIFPANCIKTIGQMETSVDPDPTSVDPDPTAPIDLGLQFSQACLSE